MTPPHPSPERSVALVTLGCTRNEVDSEELAGRLLEQGWRLVDDAAEADVAVVNTCGFVEQAKKDSIDALLDTARGRLARQRWRDVAEGMPELVTVGAGGIST